MKKLTALALFSATALCAHAQYTQVDISSDLNADIQTYSYGDNYQIGGSTLTVGTVPFALDLLNNTANTTGVIQTGDSDQTSFTFNVPAGTQATALYSLMNTAFGAATVPQGSLVVTGTGGETAILNLTEGGNIRDHNNDGFVNSLSDPTVVPTYFLNGAPTSSDISIQTRLDRQVLVLPSTFDGDTISTITFNEIDNGGDGEAFLAALTLSDVANPVPDSGSYAIDALAAMAFAAGGFILKRSRLVTVRV